MPQSATSFEAALAHGLVLLGILGWGFWSHRRDIGLLTCAVFVAGWTDLVVSALLLGTVGQLGNRIAYVGVTIAVAFGFGLLARASTSDRSATPPRWPEDTGPGSRWVRPALWLVILAVLIPTALICIGYEPDNYDSVAYRLPRAFLYLGQGTLRQLANADFRMQYYPFDMTLVYLAEAIHGLGARWLNLFSFLAWLMGAIAVWRSAREFGAGRTAALFAATLYLTAPAVLVSASSTNDDMIAGVPLLIGVLFGARWWRSASWTDAGLAAMGIGLSAGSKLHYPFLVPAAGLFGLWLGARHLVSAEKIPQLGRRAAQTLAAGAIVAILALPALAINVLDAGRPTPDLPNYQNKPFSVVAGGTTAIVSSASLFLAPIPDLDLDPAMDRRKRVYDAFNDWQNKHLFAWVSPKLNYSNEPYYRFDGVASSDAYYGMWEQSAWLGFMPWLLLLVPAFAWSRRIRRGSPASERLRLAAIWLTVAFFGWHLARCFILKYVGAAGIYYAYVAPLAATSLAWLWDAARSENHRLRRVLRLACAAVLATNLVSAANGFAFNPQRNLPELVRAHFRPRPDLVGPDLAAHLRESRRTMIAYTQWELPVADIVSVNPMARYVMAGTIGAAPTPGFDLSFMLARVRSEYSELPLQFVSDDRKRLRFLGTMQTTFGPQRAFGHAAPLSPSTTDVIADYQADTGLGNLDLASGWSPPESTHRWSDGAASTMDFDLPADAAGCVLDMKAVTLGRQHIAATLNGEPLPKLTLDSDFPGQNISAPLPNTAIAPGDLNHLVLAFDNAHAPSPEDHRRLAFGLMSAAVRCHHVLDTVAGHNRNLVFDYRPDSESDGNVLTEGWSFSERTHRWSSAQRSKFAFQVPDGRGACAFDAKMITAGSQTIAVSLNGRPLQTLHLQSWFPGADVHVAFPDDALQPGRLNDMTLRYEHTEAVGGRDLAIGLVRAAVHCRTTTDTAKALPPLKSDGFAVLSINERRDSRGGLTGLSMGRLSGVDTDEHFDMTVTVIAPDGHTEPLASSGPIAWSQWIAVPGAPTQGQIEITLRRVDQPKIEAHAYMPIASGQSIGLDLRKPGSSGS